MVPCIQTLLLNSALLMWWQFSPAYYNFVLWQFSPGLLLFCTEANLWSIFILSTILYLLLMIGLFYISLPSLNNYQVVAIQPQHTITFCIVSNSLKYLILSTILHLLLMIGLLLYLCLVLINLAHFLVFGCQAHLCYHLKVSLEFSSTYFRAYFIYFKYVFCIMLYLF